MKKGSVLMAAFLAAAAMTACTPSDISSRESSAVPEGVEMTKENTQTMSIKDKPTVEYSIPADAPTGVDGGPGVMETTAVDDSYYPEDKRSGGTETQSEGSVVCLYTVDDTGITQTMADVPALSAEAIITAMVDNGILTQGTKVLSYAQDGDSASLTLSELGAVYTDAKTEEILACIGNSLTENLGLESVDIKVGPTDYGPQSYTNEYDAT